MYKKTLSIIIIICVLATVQVFAKGKKKGDGSSNIVNVYSQRHYEVDKQIYTRFSSQTGIIVNVINGKANELIQRIVSEGKNTEADLLIVVDAGKLARAKDEGILQPIKSSTVRNLVPKAFRDPDDQWTAMTKRFRVIMYREDAIRTPIKSYADLAADSDISVAIRSSSNAYNQSLLASYIDSYGEYAARMWVRGMVKNFARVPQGNDRAQITMASKGEAQYAVANTYYLGLMLYSADEKSRAVGESMKIVFPDQDEKGTHVNISGIGLVKSSAHRKNAVQLLEFLLSNESQELFAQENYEYPVVEGVKLHPTIASWGSFKENTPSDFNVYGKYAALATQIADEEGWR